MHHQCQVRHVTPSVHRVFVCLCVCVCVCFVCAYLRVYAFVGVHVLQTSLSSLIFHASLCSRHPVCP
jgi:hypothetical protein